MTIPNFNQEQGIPLVGVSNPTNLSPTALVAQEWAKVQSGDITPAPPDDGAIPPNPVRVVVLEGRYLGDLALNGDAYYVADVHGNVDDLLNIVIGNATNANDDAARDAAQAQKTF